MTWTVILLGAVYCIMIVEVHTIRDYACLGMTAPCGFFSLNCSNGSRIQVDTLMYRTKQGSCLSTFSKCQVEEIGCCASNSTGCYETFNQDDAKSVLDKCSGRSSCGELQAVRTNQKQTPTCNSFFFNYVYVDYSCVSGTLFLNLGTDITLIEPEVNVIFDSAANDTVFRKQSTNYTCTIVQTGDKIVTLELVDIRTQKPGFTQSCSSVRISIPGANFSEECSNVSKQQNLVYNRSIIKIQLDNEWQTNFSIDNMFKQNNEDYPEMIWIKIKADQNYTVRVTCRDQKFPDNSGDTANSNIGVIIGVLIPVLFLAGIAIVGVFVFRYRYRHSLKKKAQIESHNEARYESPMEEHNSEVTSTLSSLIHSEIDASKTANTISATVSQCLHRSSEEEYYLEPSRIPEECAPRVDISFGGSGNGFHQSPRDTNGANSKSNNAVYNTSSVQYVNTVENECPKRTKDNHIEKLKDLSVEGKDMSGESKPVSDAEAMTTTDKVLKVKRSADNYIEFIHGELYDEPQKPKLVHSNDIGNGQNNLLPSTANASGKMSDKKNSNVRVYDYADPDGRTRTFPDGNHSSEDNMYEAVDDGLRGTKDDCNKTKELVTYDYADQESLSIKCSNIDSISLANKTMSFDDSYEYIQPPKENCDGVPQYYIPPPPPPPSSSSSSSLSSSLSPVSHPSSSLSSKISTRSPCYVNSPRLKAANKPITASKPNATDGYANSPKLWACKREPMPSELGESGHDLKDKGEEKQTNMLQAVLSVSALKVMFESQGNTNSFADNVDSEI